MMRKFQKRRSKNVNIYATTVFVRFGFFFVISLKIEKLFLSVCEQFFYEKYYFDYQLPEGLSKKLHCALNLFVYRFKYKTYCKPCVMFSSIFENPQKSKSQKKNI